MAVFLRSAWNAAPPKSVQPGLRLEPYGALHDIGGGDPYPSNVASTLHQIQATEQHGDYVDIAYCWGVDELGNQWELRGDVKDGATLGYSGQSFSVLAICNASAPGFVPTEAMLNGIARCFKDAMGRGVLAPNAYIDSHHWFDSHVTQSPTACCGAPLINQIPTIRQLIVGPVTPPVPPTPPAKLQTGGIQINMPNVRAKLVSTVNYVNSGGLHLFGAVYDAGAPVANCAVSIHGPAPHPVAGGSQDDWWPSVQGATATGQARGNHVVITACAPNWKTGDPCPMVEVQAVLA